MTKDINNKEHQFLKVYEENKDTVHRLCCYYFPETEDRKDLFQDIWSIIFKNLDGFEGRSSIRTWIYRIATNAALMSVNRLNRSPENKNHPDTDQIFQNLSADYDTGKVDKEKNIEQMLLLVNNLPVQDKAIISLVLEDSTGKEIAEVTGLSEENVRVRIHRIKKKLAEEFQKSKSHV